MLLTRVDGEHLGVDLLDVIVRVLDVVVVVVRAQERVVAFHLVSERQNKYRHTINYTGRQLLYIR